MKCSDCLYYYNIEINEIPECNWYPHAPGDCAPCEEEDDPAIDEYIDEDW